MSTIPQPRKKRFYKKWWFWFLLIIGVVILVGSIAAVGAFQQSRRASFEYLQNTTEVKKRILTKTISTNGTIKPDNTTTLYLNQPSTIEEVKFSVGDMVNKNDIIIATEDEDIKAPYDGKILAIHTFAGDIPAVTQPIVELGFRTNHIEFLASEAEVIDLKLDQTVTITVPAYNNGREEFTGTVQFVDSQKTTTTGSSATAAAESGYVVKISADDLPENLRNIVELSTDLTIEVAETDNVTSLEPGTIQYDDDDEPFVYLPPVVNDAFIAKAQADDDVTKFLETKDITIGFEGDDYTEITSGLKEGEEVLLFLPNSK